MDNLISITENFRDKNVLLIGGSGFVGKVLLAIFLQEVPSVGCIYILLRADSAKQVLERFINEIISSPVFEPLRQEKGAALTQYLEKHIKVIKGDITLPDLGIDSEVKSYLQENVDLIINSAGLVDFFPEITLGFSVNTMGAIYSAEFARQCKHAKLVHVSTCYVAEKKDGIYSEVIHYPTCKNGLTLNIHNEIQFLNAQISLLNIEYAHDKKSLKQALIKCGEARAEHWGYSNTYCYTKALGELALAENYKDLSYSIIRPSIIESSVAFPFSGWNEGFNTTAPISYFMGGWYPYVVAKNSVFLDIIPVDIVCKQLILVAAALLSGKSEKVYQLCSSSRNPISLKNAIYYIRTWHQHHSKHYFRTFLNARAIDLDFYLAPQNIANVFKKLELVLRKICINEKLGNFITIPVVAIGKMFSRAAKLYRVFQPFIYDHDYVFNSAAVYQLIPAEQAFKVDIKNLQWDKYWLEIHMNGLNRWIFPKYKHKEVLSKQEPILFVENLTSLIFDAPFELNSAYAN